MKLLMDVGNRRLKWALAHGDDTLGHSGMFELPDVVRGAPRASFAEQLTSQFAQIAQPESVWVSCVTRPEINEVLAQYVQRVWAVQPVFVSVPRQQASIVNGYLPAASLGSDRWAALVAAGEMFSQQSVVVVDAGTAVTVDLLDRTGFFRGGVIFPGLQTMQTALMKQTANIQTSISQTEEDTDGTMYALNEPVNSIATDTRAAVVNGALLAVAGGINLAIARQWELLQAECCVVVTGGDAERLAPLLVADIKIKPQLVLCGLAIIAREKAR